MIHNHDNDSQSMNSKSQSIGISDLPAGRVIGKHACNVTQTAERVIRCTNVIDLCFDEQSKSVNWSFLFGLLIINIDSNCPENCFKYIKCCESTPQFSGYKSLLISIWHIVSLQNKFNRIELIFCKLILDGLQR